MATSTTRSTLSPPRAPRLPDAELTYLPGYINRLLNILRLYFNQLDSFTQTVVSGDGGKYLSAPYGGFQDDLSQSTTANTATKLLIRVVDFANEVILSSSTITVVNSGIYNLQFSVQVQNYDNAPQDMFVWLRQNGVDIIGSTGVFGLGARKSAIDPYHDVKGWNYFLSMNAGDNIELWYAVTSSLVTIESYVASILPTKPSTASVVATMSFVSALP